MLGIARQLENYVNDFNESSRLIAREKLMIDLTSIVLVEEFFAASAVEAAQSNSYFSRLFKEHGSRMRYSVDSWVAREQVAHFPIPFDCLPEDMQIYFRMKHEDHTHESKSVRIRELVGQLNEGGDKDYSCIADSFDANKVENRTFPATYFVNIVYAMNVMRPKKDAIKHYEFWSLLKGQGKPVLDFWKSVNGLKDYSGLFPDIDKPRGNRTDNNEKPFGVRGMQPAWAG